MKYSTIYADPPWNTKAGPGMAGYQKGDNGQVWTSRGPSRDLTFQSMSIGQICDR